MADRAPDAAGARARSSGPRISVATGLFALATLGAALLLVAEATTLFTVKIADAQTTIRNVGTGSHHSYALIPVALLTLFLAWGVLRAGSRPALLAIGVLGVLTLLIALIGDLPDAHLSGYVGAANEQLRAAVANPSTGLYLETLGAVVLLITCVSGFILLGPPRPTGRANTASVGQTSSIPPAAGG